MVHHETVAIKRFNGAPTSYLLDCQYVRAAFDDQAVAADTAWLSLYIQFFTLYKDIIQFFTLYKDIIQFFTLYTSN